MTMEVASVTVVRAPWGKTDLRPFSELGHDGAPVGELRFQRADRTAPDPALLLKLLFIDEPLSIQVHPDDSFAQAIGLPHGRTKAWYVLAAEPGARVALGLKREMTRAQLRAAIADGSIADLVRWQDVAVGQGLLVPAGTIHAIGAGLVLVEIQQRSEAGFRLFDHGRQHDIQLDGAVGAALPGPAAAQVPAMPFSESRTVIAQSPHFVLEAVDLLPNSHWELDAGSETWLLLLEGDAIFGRTQVVAGEAVLIDGERTIVRPSARGARGILAYVAAAPLPGLLLGRNGIPIAVVAERFPDLGLGQQLQPEPAARPWARKP